MKDICIRLARVDSDCDSFGLLSRHTIDECSDPREVSNAIERCVALDSRAIELSRRGAQLILHAG